MTAYIPKSLTEEIKLFTFGRKSFYMKDLFTLCVFAGFYFTLSGFVNEWFKVPYIIFAAVMSLYLILPANATNPGKRNWEAILIMLTKNRSTVFSVNPKTTEGFEILKILPQEEKSNG